MSELIKDCVTRWGKNTHGKSCKEKKSREEWRKKILECNMGD
jgi:hypothetical protein